MSGPYWVLVGGKSPVAGPLSSDADTLRKAREIVRRRGYLSDRPLSVLDSLARELDRECAEAEVEAANRELVIAKFAEAIPGFDPDSEYGMRVVDAAVQVLRERDEEGAK